MSEILINIFNKNLNKNQLNIENNRAEPAISDDLITKVNTIFH